MAPDLNSVPTSPRNIALSSRPTSTSSSRRASQLMGPPPLPLASPGGSLPQQYTMSGHPPAPPNTSSMASSTTSTLDNAGVGVGPGPLRHPRPLTAADLHLQLEKEQEAVVNRLTRELSLLRQQSASVVSNASSTSTGLADSTDHHANHLISGTSHPTPSRRHRSSSSLSQTTAATTTSASTVGTTAGVAGSTVSGIAPARDSTAPPTSQAAADRARDTLSRQNSMTSSRRSGTSSPSISSSLQHTDHFLHSYSSRHSISSQHGGGNHPQSVQFAPQSTLSPDNPRSPSLSSAAAATTRYEEAAYHRSELDVVKRENETLRRRIRELERSLSSRRDSDAGRRRSTSATTSAGVNAGLRDSGGQRGRGLEKDDDDESVGVGESAGSVGVGGGQ
ncbi:MAG: hypothetical protein M1830_005542 [Pleopsidium flavum]|nr:MAG: hypothetical protein M1830_005542 [Pleopsidium flavum]